MKPVFCSLPELSWNLTISKWGQLFFFLRYFVLRLPLQDLLNPESNDDSIVDTDPYGAAFLEDDESEDDDTPVITRSGALNRLEIDSIINLAEPKLIARFKEHPSASLITKAPATQVSQKTSQKWFAVNTNWAAKDDFDF